MTSRRPMLGEPKPLTDAQRTTLHAYIHGHMHRWAPDFGDLKALLDAHDYWRARCSVTRDDVVEANLQPRDVLTYALAHGWEPRDADDVEALHEDDDNGGVVLVHAALGRRMANAMVYHHAGTLAFDAAADACNLIARAESRAPHDVLVELRTVSQ